MPDGVSLLISAVVQELIELVKKGYEDLTETDPIRVAVERTCANFPKYEGLRYQLKMLLGLEAAHRSLKDLAESGFCSGHDELVNLLTGRDVEFDGPLGDAKAIIRAFCDYFKEELLRTPDAQNVLYAQQEEATRTLLSEDRETRRELGLGHASLLQRMGEMGGKIDRISTAVSKPSVAEERLDEQYDRRIDTARKLLEDGEPKAAKEEYLSIVEDLRRERPPNPTLLGRSLNNLGVCELRLREFGSALTHFEEAHGMDREREDFAVNLGRAHLANQHPQRALELADTILAKSPTSLEATYLRANALDKLGRHGEAVKLFPPVKELDWQGRLFLAFIHYDNEEHAQACQILEIEESEQPEYMRVHAESILSLALGKARKALPWMASPATLCRLRKAEALLSKVIEHCRPREPKYDLVECLINRGTARLALGDAEGAAEDCRECLQHDRENAEAMRKLASACVLLGQFDQAIASAERALDLGGEPGVCVGILASAHLGKDPPDVESLLRFFKEGPVAARLKESNLDVGLALVRALLAADRGSEARALLDNLSRNFGHEPEFIIAEAECNLRSGDKEEGVRRLRGVANEQPPPASLAAALSLADYYYQEQNFDLAAQYYERVSNPSVPNDVLKRHLRSLYQSSDQSESFPKCLGLCREVREVHGVLPGISDLEAFVCEGLGRLPEAIEIYQALTERYPDETEYRVRLALTKMRGGDLTEAAKLVQPVIKALPDDPHQLMASAHVAFEAGKRRQGVELAYRTLASHPDNPDCHRFYAGLIIALGNERCDWMDSDTVAADTVVTIAEDGEERELVVLTDEEPVLFGIPIQLDSELGRLLRGRKTDDSVTLAKDELAERTVEIRSVKSKFVAAFQHVLEDFNIRFAQEPGLFRVRMDPEFTKLKQELQKQSEHAEQALHLYAEGKLTIGAFANLIGRDVLVSWLGLAASPELSFLCTRGTLDDISGEYRCAAEADGVVIDITALFTAAHFKLLDVFARKFSTVLVAQQVVDEVRRLVSYLEHFDRQANMVVFELHGKYYKEDITEATLEAKRDLLRDMATFVDRSCIVSGLDAPGSPKLDKLPDIVGAPQAATMLLARQRSQPLLADDTALRGLAEHELQVPGFDTTAVLRASADQGIITYEQRSKALARLFRAGYKFIALDAGIVWETARLAGFALQPPFTLAIDQVGAAVGQETKVVAAVAEFIKILYLAPVTLPNTAAARLVHAFMDKLVGRRANRRAVVNGVKRAVRRRLRMAPSVLQRAMLILESWERSKLL